LVFLNSVCDRLTYGILVGQLSIVAGSAPGLVLSLWLNMQAVKLQYARSYSEQMRKLLLKNVQEVELPSTTTTGVGVDGDKNNHADAEMEQSMSFIDIENTQDPTDDDESEIRPKNQQQQPPVQTSELSNHQDEFDLLILNVYSSMHKVKTSANQENVLLIVSSFWVIIVVILLFIEGLSLKTQQTTVGIAVNLNLVVFYGAPLSTIYDVMNTKLSASIHIPTMVLNTTNGLLWSVYGLFVRDIVVTIPNGIGVMLGCIQIVLCLIYPREPYDAFSKRDSMNSRRRTIVMLNTMNHNNNPMEGPSILSMENKKRNIRSSQLLGEILADPIVIQDILSDQQQLHRSSRTLIDETATTSNLSYFPNNETERYRRKSWVGGSRSSSEFIVSRNKPDQLCL
jgi:solute carrier family 50 (sugar transporter)